MSPRLRAGAIGALAGAAAGFAAVVLLYAWSPALSIGFAVTPPRLVTGVYPAERDAASGLTFAWSGADLALRIPGLDRRVPWTMAVRLKGGRSPADNPAVVFSVDGLRAATHPTDTDWSTVELRIPERPERPRGVLVTMQPSGTFVPGPSDPRPLGVMLDQVRLAPDGVVFAPRDALLRATLAAGAMGLAFGLMGLTGTVAAGGAVLVAAAQAALLTRGFGPFTDFGEHALILACSIGTAAVAAVLVVEALRRRSLETAARLAVAVTAAALFLKLLVQFHPDMPIGDALFQAHRFQEVLRGNYYFTSIAPGNYLFPYAPGLYVAAAPFADLVRREMGDVALLRVVVASADAVAGALLYWAVQHGWQDRRAALAAALVYHLLPIGFLVASAGTLTSAFAQSVAVVSLAVAAASWVRMQRPAAVALLTFLCAAAYLSHTSTFATLATTMVAIVALLAWRGGPDLRSPAAAIGLAGLTAVAIAVAVYYAHFIETYRTELARIGSETAAAAPDAGGRSISERAAAVPYYLQIYYGMPAIILSALGVHRLWIGHERNRLTLTIAGLAAACLAFLALGIVTPVDMRYYVSALPVVALTGAAGASYWWSTGSWRRLVVAGLLAWVAWDGLGTWWRVLA